ADAGYPPAGILLAGVLGGGALAYAGPWTLPTSSSFPFQDAGPLYASDLNNNFQYLAEAGTGLDARVTALEKSLANVPSPLPQAHFSGAAPQVLSGNLIFDLIEFTGTDFNSYSNSYNKGMYTCPVPGTYAVTAYSSMSTTEETTYDYETAIMLNSEIVAHA